MSGTDDIYTDRARLLLPYFTNQVPAHATYIVTTSFGIFAPLIGAFVNLNRPYVLGLVVVVIGLSIFFLFYFYGRLLYYNESISVLNDILGLNSASTQSDYLEFCENADNKRSFKGFANLIQLEVIYRSNLKISRPTCAIRLKYWLIRRVFFFQRRNPVWKEQISILAEVHNELETRKSKNKAEAVQTK